MDEQIHALSGLRDLIGIMLAVTVQLGAIFPHEESGEAIHGAERRAEVVSNMITNALQRPNGFLQIGRALGNPVRQKLGMLPQLFLSVLQCLLSFLALHDFVLQTLLLLAGLTKRSAHDFTGNGNRKTRKKEQNER